VELPYGLKRIARTDLVSTLYILHIKREKMPMKRSKFIPLFIFKNMLAVIGAYAY